MSQSTSYFILCTNLFALSPPSQKVHQGVRCIRIWCDSIWNCYPKTAWPFWKLWGSFGGRVCMWLCPTMPRWTNLSVRWLFPQDKAFVWKDFHNDKKKIKSKSWLHEPPLRPVPRTQRTQTLKALRWTLPLKANLLLNRIQKISIIQILVTIFP